MTFDRDYKQAQRERLQDELQDELDANDHTGRLAAWLFMFAACIAFWVFAFWVLGAEV